MSIRINIVYPHLQQLTGNQETITVDGRTVGECLGHLVKQFPGIEKGIFDEHGQLLNYIYFLINGKSIYPGDLARSVQDGDDLTIALLLAGG